MPASRSHPTYPFSAHIQRCVMTLFLGLLILGGIGQARASSAAPVETAAVMAPLIIPAQDMATFDTLLAEAKSIGVNAVTVDVWWGAVESGGDQAFDWSYYDNVFQRISSQGLKIVPILSFHKCGGGPGDDCSISLPTWLWSHFLGQGLTELDLKYQSETGKVQDDAIAPWATENAAVLSEFQELMAAFQQHFAPIAGDFVEINISLGPTGELRYPSYNKTDPNETDGWKFPQRGFLQSYSDHAQAHFRNWALNRFGGLSGVNQRWGLSLPNPTEIRVPGGHLPPNIGARAETFFKDNDHFDTQYGRDFVDWYHGSLVAHGQRLLAMAHATLNGPMQGIPLGMKLPGIHWQMKCTDRPRTAEISAGLVATTLDLSPTGAARADAYGYRRTMEMIRDVKQMTGREIILHFTALEMDNDPACPLTPNDVNTSMAEALVFWISHGADDHGIRHKGENALGCVAAFPQDDRTWASIRSAFTHAPYRGFTFLRLTNKTSDNCTPWNPADRGQYQSFIADFVGSGQPLIVHLREWEPCLQNQGCQYNLHAFGGLSGDFALSYEGPFNGSHWWEGQIPNAPNSFGFTFNNTNGWEGGPGQFDRQYDRSSHGNEIFTVGRGNTQVHTTRP